MCMNVAVINILKRIAVIISVLAIGWCLIDPVFAENSSTYFESPANECFAISMAPVGSDTLYTFYKANAITRTVAVRTSNNSNFVYVISVSDVSFKGNKEMTYSSACSISSNTINSSSISYNSQTYYYAMFLNNSVNINELADNIPVVNYVDGESVNLTAVRYTYGDAAVDPIPEVTYGLLDDVGFTTDIAGTGNASTSNLDTISWNPVYDTNGNNIMGADVIIRAVPGHYSADSKQNLFEKVRSDFILDNTDLAVLDTVNVEEGSFSITWGQVISAFSLPFGNFISWFKTDEVFLKQGWIYQIQFTKGDYTSEWQTVYTIQSESPADSLHVINSTVIDQDTINILQQINTMNNSLNIWIIDETPVDPNDNYTPPSSDDEKPWWAYLLEMINNSIGITNKYINDGTDESQQVVNNIETNNNDLDVTVNEYHDIENDLVTDMNDRVTDLDIEEDLSSDASFLSSARWVTEQFNTIVSNNPIGMILKFSLVLGFVTIFLGRFR